MAKACWGRAAAITLGLTLACACARPAEPLFAPQQVPLGGDYGRSGSFSESSGSGSPTSDYSSAKGLSVPQRERSTDRSRLSVRPDLVRVAFAVRDGQPTPQAALQAARATFERISNALIKATRATASTKVIGLSLVRNFRNGVSASVDGELQVPLTANEDFWARSQLYALIVETTERLTEQSQRKDEPLHAVSFEIPRLEVLDPEAYRPQLLERWVERARQFSAAAQTAPTPLVIRDCTPPGAVAQSAASFDEVSLELTIACRIDTPRDDQKH